MNGQKRIFMLPASGGAMVFDARDELRHYQQGAAAAIKASAERSTHDSGFNDMRQSKPSNHQPV